MLSSAQSEHQVEQLYHQYQHQYRQRIRNLWDDLPSEIQTKILWRTEPLTRYLHGLMTPAALRNIGKSDYDCGISIWRTACETNYSGDLRILPAPKHGQILPDTSSFPCVTSRDMHERLCQFQPSRRSIGENTLFKFNRYSTETFDVHESERLSESFIHIPMSNGWYDMLEVMSSQYPIACARIALKYGHTKYFKYLVETYGVDPSKLVPEEEERISEFTTHPLQYAYLAGDLELALLCEEIGIQVDTKCVDNACVSGNVECVRHLLENYPQRFTQSAMSESVEKGHLEIVKILYEDAHLTDIREAVEIALWNGHASAVTYLLSKSPETISSRVVLFATTWKHEQALLNYIKYGTIAYDKATVAAIAAVCPDTTLLQSIIDKMPELFDENTMRQACLWGRVEVVRLIHETLPHIKATPSNLYCACQGKHVDVVKYLVEIMNVEESSEDDFLMDAAMPNFPLVHYVHTKSNSPCHASTLLKALRHGRRDIFNYLYTHFPEVCVDSCAQSSLLAFAAVNDDMGLLIFLLENGLVAHLNLDFHSSLIWNQNFRMLEFGLMNGLDGMDTLQFAARTGDWELFREVFGIVERVHPQVISEKKWSAAMLRDVVRSRNTDIFRFVLSFVEDPCMLGEAVKMGDLSLVDYLCMNCSKSMIIRSSHDAFETACLHGHLDVAKYFLDHYPSTCSIDNGLSQACISGHPSLIRFLAPLASEKGIEKARFCSSVRKYRSEFLESILEK
jgi:hypothetical protein